MISPEKSFKGELEDLFLKGTSKKKYFAHRNKN